MLTAGPSNGTNVARFDEYALLKLVSVSIYSEVSQTLPVHQVSSREPEVSLDKRPPWKYDDRNFTTSGRFQTTIKYLCKILIPSAVVQAHSQANRGKAQAKFSATGLRDGQHRSPHTRE
jgi:hypothetical protein